MTTMTTLHIPGVACPENALLGAFGAVERGYYLLSDERAALRWWTAQSRGTQVRVLRHLRAPWPWVRRAQRVGARLLRRQGDGVIRADF